MNAYTLDGSGWTFGEKTFSEATSEISINFLKTDLTGPEELAAKFPKYCKVKISGVTCFNEPSYRTVNFNVSVTTNRVTGDANEAGMKRRAKILEILKQLGFNQ